MTAANRCDGDKGDDKKWKFNYQRFYLTVGVMLLQN
jgi:hypothetical protein